MGQTESRMPRRSSSSAFLLKPRTEINKHMGKQPNISHGMACMQGWRAHMEDAHVMRASLPGLEGWSFYAVLDGHAGKKVAEISGTTLAGTVLYEVLPVRDSIEGVQAAIRRAFIKHDHMLQKNPEVLRDRSGSTCTSVLITPTHFIFANVGDSRTVLVREGKVEFSTIDHKPTLPVERSRITGAGGCVLNGRVDGGLAVSRAFGDFDYKMRSDLSILQQKVSPEPDVTVISRTDKDEYLILACDGIWDVMTSNAAHRFVEQRLKRSKDDLASACEALVHRCLGLGSRDNMSAVLVVPTLPVYLSMPSTPPEKLPQDVCKAVIMRVAASVAFSAIASGIAHMIECRSTSFIPRYPIPVHCPNYKHTTQGVPNNIELSPYQTQGRNQVSHSQQSLVTNVFPDNQSQELRHSQHIQKAKQTPNEQFEVNEQQTNETTEKFFQYTNTTTTAVAHTHDQTNGTSILEVIHEEQVEEAEYLEIKATAEIDVCANVCNPH